jgi:hypothetical protein
MGAWLRDKTLPAAIILLPSGYGQAAGLARALLLGILLWLNNGLRYIWNDDDRR